MISYQFPLSLKTKTEYKIWKWYQTPLCFQEKVRWALQGIVAMTEALSFLREPTYLVGFFILLISFSFPLKYLSNVMDRMLNWIYYLKYIDFSLISVLIYLKCFHGIGNTLKYYNIWCFYVSSYQILYLISFTEEA